MIPTLDPRVISYIQKYLLVNKEPWEFYKKKKTELWGITFRVCKIKRKDKSCFRLYFKDSPR